MIFDNEADKEKNEPNFISIQNGHIKESEEVVSDIEMKYTAEQIRKGYSRYDEVNDETTGVTYAMHDVREGIANKNRTMDKENGNRLQEESVMAKNSEEKERVLEHTEEQVIVNDCSQKKCLLEKNVECI